MGLNIDITAYHRAAMAAFASAGDDLDACPHCSAVAGLVDLGGGAEGRVIFHNHDCPLVGQPGNDERNQT